MKKKPPKTFEEKMDARFDDLAIMISRGFEETATRTELAEVKKELKADIAEVNMRLDRIDNLLIRNLDNRVERLEDKLLQVEVILGKRLK